MNKLELFPIPWLLLTRSARTHLFVMQLREKMPDETESEYESPELLDRRISEAEKAVSFSRAFLDQLCVEDKDLEERIEEIALSYEREVDRLHLKKARSEMRKCP